MKVAFINSVAGFGSTGKICRDLASMEGIEGKLFFGRKTNETSLPAYKMTNLFGNVKHAIDTIVFGIHGFSNTKETERLVTELKKFKPDLIHLHNLHGFYMNVEVLFDYLKESQIPVIWTLHDCWSFTGHCAHYEAIGCKKWQVKCEKCPALMTYPYTLNGSQVTSNYIRKKRVFTSLDASQLTIVTPSKWLASQVSQSFLQKYPVQVIPNGISLEIFYPRAKEKANTFELLACASVWTKEKGLDDLIALSNQLHENEHLTIVGITTKQAKHFSSQTTCMERTADVEALCKLYSNADVFLNPTYQDTFPTVNIEALACGCPIITYPSGGSPEIINEETGIVTKGKSIQDLRESIDTFYKQQNNYTKQACVKQASQYTKEAMLENYRKLYLQN